MASGWWNEKEIFLMVDKIRSQLKLYCEQIKEKFEETETTTLNLEVDTQIQCVLSQRCDIGKVVCRKERKCLQIPSEEKPFEQCQVEIEKVVDIKGPDNKSPNYTGVTYLQGDQVMLVDWYNKRVLLLNSSYQCIASFTLSGDPYGICVVDHEDVAVSIGGEKTLQFLSVARGTIKTTRQVQTRYTIWGVASAGKGDIIVSGCIDKCKYYWSLITSTGEEKKCHQFDCQGRYASTNVALNSSFTRVYITVSVANSIYCFDMDGRMMYKYNLKHPLGVATDRDDNVYVAGYSSGNIHQLTSDGTPIRIITDGIPENPKAICFNNSRDKFLITSYSEARKKICMFRFK